MKNLITLIFTCLIVFVFSCSTKSSDSKNNYVNNKNDFDNLDTWLFDSISQIKLADTVDLKEYFTSHYGGWLASDEADTVQNLDYFLKAIELLLHQPEINKFKINLYGPGNAKTLKEIIERTINIRIQPFDVSDTISLTDSLKFCMNIPGRTGSITIAIVRHPMKVIELYFYAFEHNFRYSLFMNYNGHKFVPLFQTGCEY